MFTNMVVKISEFTALALFVALSGSSVLRAAEPTASSEWSDTVGGLRGLLVVACEGNSNTPSREVIVYLELQNVAPGARPLQVFYGNDRDYCSLRWEFCDSSNRPVPTKPIGIIRPVRTPYWIMLPGDSTFRLRVSTGSISGLQQVALFMLLPTDNLWVIPAESSEDYFLSAVFDVPQRRKLGHSVSWEGCLTLPKVRIPTKNP